MDPTFTYLAAKGCEYASTLEWLQVGLTNLASDHILHSSLLNDLTGRISAARHKVRLLETIANSGLSSLWHRGVSIVKELEYEVILLSYYYLPALSSEGWRELQYRQMALDAARRCGLHWVDDLVVDLRGGHATIPVNYKRPLLFAPLHQVATLLDLAGMYHEFGHIVYSCFTQIGGRLTAGVQEHFGALLRVPGPMSPDQRAERSRAIADAIAYWDDVRVNELFCDIFGTYVCGCAYFHSVVDMSIRLRARPFHIDRTDPHPPLAARVEVCEKTLSAGQKKSAFCGKLSLLWRHHASQDIRTGDFQLVCSDALLGVLAVRAIEAIEGDIGSVPRYAREFLVPGDMGVFPGEPLEDLLNAAVVRLLDKPEDYPGWERPFVDALFPVH